MKKTDIQVEEMLPGVPLFKPRNGRAVDTSWIPDITAMRPLYLHDFGNSTHIYTPDRELYWGHNVVQTANDINRYWLHSHREMMLLYMQYTKRSQSAPLVNRFTGQPLAAVKMRHPSGRNDGAMGYVHTSYIDRLETLYLADGGYGTTIHLTTGKSVISLWGPSQVHEQIQRAKYVANELYKQGRITNNQQPMQGAVDLYNAIMRLIRDLDRGGI